MAWGSYKEQWTRVHTDSRYKIDVQWRYKQDPIANKTYYETEQIKITKVKSDLKPYNETGSARAGIAVITGTRATYSIKLDLRTATSQTFNLKNDHREFTNHADGKPKDKTNIHWYFKANTNTETSPEYTWHIFDVTSLISAVDRRTGTTTLSNTTSTKNSLSVKASMNFYTTSSGRYRLDKGAWKYFKVDPNLQQSGGGSMNLTIGGLKPDTKYLVEVQFQRAHNELWSESDSIYVTTKKPAAPSISGLKMSTVGVFSTNLILSNVVFDSPATWGYISYRPKGGSWVRSNARDNEPIFVNNLKPNTTQTVEVKVTDNYDTDSNILPITFTTLIDQATIDINVKDLWSKGKLFIHVNGIWMKSKKNYANDNGVWKNTI